MMKILTSKLDTIKHFALLPVKIPTNSIYYIFQYFLIKRIVRKEYNNISHREAFHSESKYKFITATTYVSLSIKLLFDVTLRKKTSIYKKDEFIALIHLYFLVILADNTIDDSKENTDKIKAIRKVFFFFKEKAKDINKSIELPFSREVNNEIFLFIENFSYLYRNNPENPYALNRFIKSLNAIEVAYIKETKANTLKRHWSSLYRISSVTVTFYECIMYSMIGLKIKSRSEKIVLRSFAFSGNILDEWMDYYWIKEDMGKNCLIEHIIETKGYSKDKYLLLYGKTFFQTLMMLSKKLNKVRKETLDCKNSAWVLPAFMMVALVVSPISIVEYFLEKKYAAYREL